MKSFFIIVLSAPVIFLFPYFAVASVCIAPTPPVCFSTEPAYSSVGVQSDGAIVSADGHVLMPNGNMLFNPTKQIVVNCAGSQKQIDYQADLLSYGACSQSSSSSSNQSYCFAPIPTGCTSQNDVGALTVKLNMNGIPNPAAIKACQDQVTQNNLKIAAYNSCLSQKSVDLSSAPVRVPVIPSTTVASTNFCNTQHGVYAYLNGGYCACPLVGYDWDNNKQCVPNALNISSDSQISNPPLDSTNISKSVLDVYNTYYPDSLNLLNKTVVQFTAGDMTNTKTSFLILKTIFKSANDKAIALNIAYRDKKISEESTNDLYSVKVSTNACYSTIVIMLNGDSGGIGSGDGLRKCNDWSNSLEKTLGVISSTSLPTATQRSLSYAFTRNLKKGMNGMDVGNLQTILQKIGYLATSTQISGYFGLITQKAVISFQKNNNISPSLGYVGIMTQKKLIELIQ